MGIHVDSPLQRQWTILDLSGSILRITTTVLGAACSSSRAVNVRVPTRILSMPNTNRPTISTHVLDTTRGEPAARGIEDVRRNRWTVRSEEHTSELQSRPHLVCRLLLEKKKTNQHTILIPR